MPRPGHGHVTGRDHRAQSPDRHDHRRGSRKPVWRIGLALLLVCCLWRNSVQAGPVSTSAHPPLRAASEIEYPPFCYLDSAGKLTGFSVELLRAALKAMGREVTFQLGPWAEVKDWLAHGQVQVLPLVGRPPEREHLFDFTFPYMKLHGALVVRRGTSDIRTMADLRGRRVAVMRGDNAEEFLRRHDFGVAIQTTPTFVEALAALAAGQCDAVVIQRLVALRLLQEHDFANLEVIPHPIEGFRQDFCFAVKKGDHQTLALLNEGLALVIADGTYRRLHTKWFASLELPTHRRLVVGGDHNYPPFEFLDSNGRPTGFSVELTRAIAQEMGLDLEIRLGPWHAIMEGLAQGEIDVVQGMYYSVERDQQFDFSQPYIVNHHVSVVRQDAGPPPTTVKDLAGRVLVAQRGDFILNFLTQHGLRDHLLLVETQEDVLQAVAAGRAEVGLVVRLGALYLMEKKGYTNLVIGRTPLVAAEYCYAVRQGEKAVLAQFSEGLNVLADSGEFHRLREKWFAVYRQETVTLLEALRYSAMVLIPLVLALAGFLLWSWTLRQQVAKRTAALRQSEARFRSLVEGAPDAIFVQIDHRFAYLNNSACQLFGAATPAQLLGQPVMARFHPAHREIIAQRIQQLNIGKERVPALEEIYLRLDGSEVPVEVSAVPIHYEGKDGALVFVRDISDRKRAEQELQRRQVMLTRTEAIAHVGSWEWEVATDTVTWSDELFRIFQRDPAAGAPPFARHQELFHPDDMRHLSRLMARAVHRGTPFELELRVVRPDGTIRHCLGRGFPELGEDGKVTRLYGSLQDITEFKLAQQRIAHLNTILRAIREIDQLIVRVQDQETFIQQCAQILVEKRGYSRVLIVLLDGQQRVSHWALTGVTDMGAIRAALDRLFSQPEPLPCFQAAANCPPVLILPNREGLCQVCPLVGNCEDSLALVTRLQHEDICFGYVAAAADPNLSVDQEETELFQEMAADLAFALHYLQVQEARHRSDAERRLLEEQLLQAQKLEAVGRLAGGVAHDFNNMLGVILGHAEIALMQLPPDHPLVDELREIIKAAKRSADLTRQLLAFARRQTIAPQVLDLNDTVEAMLQMLERLIGEDIELIWLPGQNLWPVKMDPSQLHQILANLCVNARDAINGGGQIIIETHAVSLDQAYCATHAGCVPGDYVLLMVTDNGCGMAKETLDNIFEPFFTTKGVGEGTGLGLATVYGIVKQNKGFIHVYSEPGQGTTFKIYLPPYLGVWEKPAKIAGGATPQGQGETVLLVEDEEPVLKLTRQMLTRLGYRVLVASRPEEAIQLAKDHAGPLHLLVTDVIMPKMNGAVLAGEIQRLHPHCQTVFISGYTANVIAKRGILTDGVHFLAKPFSLQELAIKVRAALEQAAP